MDKRLVCTIITKKYLAHARVLAESVREHNPALPPLLVLLADRVEGYFDPAKEPFQMIQLEDLEDQEAIRQMSFYYTPFELCCALRGYLHSYILTHTDAQSWIFFDSDILVLNNLSSIFQQIEAHAIVLTPHLDAPVDETIDPNDIETPEVSVLRSGLYNGGFLGLQRTNETLAFISWFKQRLRWFCFDEDRCVYVDQAWLNYVPLFFNKVSLLRNLGANLGYWKLRGRIILREISGFTVDNAPILFFHFTGWDPVSPKQVSKFYPALDAYICPGWVELATEYAQRLQRFGYDTAMQFPYAFATFADGYPVYRHHRRAYYLVLRAQRWPGGSPFIKRRAFLWRVYRNKLLWRRFVRWFMKNIHSNLLKA